MLTEDRPDADGNKTLYGDPGAASSIYSKRCRGIFRLDVLTHGFTWLGTLLASCTNATVVVPRMVTISATQRQNAHDIPCCLSPICS